MSAHIDRSALEVRYLLGELAEREEENFERQYFSDDDLFEKLQITEAELIDAYVVGELSEPERRHLEKRLENSARLRERLAFASTLATATSTVRNESEEIANSTAIVDPWWKKIFAGIFGQMSLTPALAVTVVLILLGAGLVIMQSLRLRNESRRLEAERAEIARHRDELARLSAQQHDQTVAELREAQSRYERAEALVKSLQEQQSQTPVKPTFASITLLPGSLRSGGGGNELKLESGTTVVQLQLALLSVDYQKYRVTITGPTNREIRRDGLKPTSRKTLSLKLPARMLPMGQYTVSVSGITANGTVETVSDYAFGVSQKSAP